MRNLLEKIKFKRNSEKGMGASLAVMSLAIFLFMAFAIALGALGKLQVINEKKLLRERIGFQSQYARMTGEANQFLVVNNFEDMDPSGYIGSERGVKLSEWLALYDHANDTSSKIHLNITDPDSVLVNVSDMRKILKDRMNRTINHTVPEDIYYNLTTSNITLERKIKDNLRSYSSALVPIPAPGGRIFYVRYNREGTAFSLQLTED